MQTRVWLNGAAVALIGWFAFAPVNLGRAASGLSYPVADSTYGQRLTGSVMDTGNIHDVDWYQGQEGKWYRGPGGKWQWRGGRGNEWYYGERGHWYKENNGWQFGSDGLVCNNQGRDCRKGRYLPANGQGMVNRKNPNLYWKCDSDGNHCNWARRPL